jgi:hypothetical protein
MQAMVVNKCYMLVNISSMGNEIQVQGLNHHAHWGTWCEAWNVVHWEIIVVRGTKMVVHAVGHSELFPQLEVVLEKNFFCGVTSLVANYVTLWYWSNFLGCW